MFGSPIMYWFDHFITTRVPAMEKMMSFLAVCVVFLRVF